MHMGFGGDFPESERIEDLVRARARAAVLRAVKAGLPFDHGFVEDSVHAVRRAGHRCALTRRAFDIDYRTKGAGGTHYAPSPDRIRPELGYVRGNVRWILWCINRGKGEIPAEDYLAICRLVARRDAEVERGRDTADDFANHGAGMETRPVGAARAERSRYTRQQVAAFKAHVTMTKRSLDGLRGARLAAAREKLARYEARLAAALTDSGGNGLGVG